MDIHNVAPPMTAHLRLWSLRWVTRWRLRGENFMPKKRSLASAVLVCLWVGIYGASPVNAQQPDIKAIQELLESGNHAAAFAEAQKLEATAKAQFGINHP